MAVCPICDHETDLSRDQQHCEHLFAAVAADVEAVPWEDPAINLTIGELTPVDFEPVRGAVERLIHAALVRDGSADFVHAEATEPVGRLLDDVLSDWGWSDSIAATADFDAALWIEHNQSTPSEPLCSVLLRFFHADEAAAEVVSDEVSSGPGCSWAWIELYSHRPAETAGRIRAQLDLMVKEIEHLIVGLRS